MEKPSGLPNCTGVMFWVALWAGIPGGTPSCTKAGSGTPTCRNDGIDRLSSPVMSTMKREMPHKIIIAIFVTKLHLRASLESVSVLPMYVVYSNECTYTQGLSLLLLLPLLRLLHRAGLVTLLEPEHVSPVSMRAQLRK